MRRTYLNVILEPVPYVHCERPSSSIGRQQRSPLRNRPRSHRQAEIPTQLPRHNDHGCRIHRRRWRRTKTPSGYFVTRRHGARRTFFPRTRGGTCRGRHQPRDSRLRTNAPETVRGSSHVEVEKAAAPVLFGRPEATDRSATGRLFFLQVAV